MPLRASRSVVGTAIVATALALWVTARIAVAFFQSPSLVLAIGASICVYGSVIFLGGTVSSAGLRMDDEGIEHFGFAFQSRLIIRKRIDWNRVLEAKDCGLKIELFDGKSRVRFNLAMFPNLEEASSFVRARLPDDAWR